MIKVKGKNKFTEILADYNERNGHIIVLAGSKYRQNTTSSLLPHIKRYREEVLKKIGSSEFRTTNDFEFNSPGSAACVLCGTMINGLDFFKTINENKTLNEAVFKNKKVKESRISYKPLLLEENKKYKRIYSVGKEALKASDYLCYVDPKHETFVTDNGLPYMEAHHLIPFKYQYKYKYSVQVPANIVCLCPSCHRELHYGKDKEKILKRLYNDRIKYLRKSKLNPSFEDLLSFYNLKKK